ncbi:MAG: exodeoxyribonuclease VII large subunit [Methanobrevibacter sp.]|jgi:exodeoxyribonuclease VII large subunit|nr:exodeoxyribonuclease VII large subunit [Methanobrevibacter sp.]
MDNYEVLSVSILNKYIKEKFVNDENLIRIKLRGELSNFKIYSSGHLYFSLKDDNSKISAVMFKYQAIGLNFKPTNGMTVVVHGKVNVYEVNGQYQFYVNQMFEDGMGDLFLAYEALKKKLRYEGLFNREKSYLPKFPKKIGVVTSPTGAVIHDIITTIRKRWPFVEVILWPTQVQGNQTKNSIERNIRLASESDVDVLIIGRGGGSIEDIWGFNEEIVVRAIADSNIPIISAVGHETDITLSDLVADMRAPTPTAAAEIVVPNIVEIRNQLNNNKIRLNEFMLKKMEYIDNYLTKIKENHILNNPLELYEKKLDKLGLLQEKVNNIFNDRIKTLENHLILLNQKLIILNPLETVNRGYSIIKIKNKVVSSINKVEINNNLTIELKDGYIETKVKKINKK